MSLPACSGTRFSPAPAVLGQHAPVETYSLRRRGIRASLHVVEVTVFFSYFTAPPEGCRCCSLSSVSRAGWTMQTCTAPPQKHLFGRVTGAGRTVDVALPPSLVSPGRQQRREAACPATPHRHTDIAGLKILHLPTLLGKLFRTVHVHTAFCLP